MSNVTIEEAQARLAELIDKLAPGEEVVITRNDQPVAQLIGLSSERPHPVPGRCEGMLTILAEDDEHLQDWAEYMHCGSLWADDKSYVSMGLENLPRYPQSGHSECLSDQNHPRSKGPKGCLLIVLLGFLAFLVFLGLVFYGAIRDILDSVGPWIAVPF